MNKILLTLILFSSCDQRQTNLSKQAAQEIIAADKACCDMAVKEGFFKALLYYSDDSIIKPKEGELPVIGKKILVDHYSVKKETKDISWEPYRAEAANSGEMGYSFGNWKYTTKDTIMYGNYYTIWKKQKDGTWKFVVDGGNNTPRPAN